MNVWIELAIVVALIGLNGFFALACTGMPWSSQ